MSKDLSQTLATDVEQPSGRVWRTFITDGSVDQQQLQVLLGALVDNALNGTLTWQNSVVVSINDAIAELDKRLSEQLVAIMHQDEVSQLEGSWRGLQHLLKHTETNPNLKIKCLQASKTELSKDADKAVEFDQSQLFEKVYEREFGTPGGEPYGILVGDYQFSHHPQELNLLRHLSNVAAAAFCPFLSAASSRLFGLSSWTELAKPRDLAKIFDAADYAKWRSFRQSDDAGFVTLTLPRALARLPYGSATQSIEAFAYEETVIDHDDYCWMNAAYLLATRITQAYNEYGWSTAIRGAEGGGKVENLPLHTVISEEGDWQVQCPTETGITDRREAELSHLGFLSLCHYKNSDHAVFFGAQTLQQSRKYDQPAASANAAISARLPYVLATSRFAHYLKVMARDKLGSFMQTSDCENWLNNWILQYVNANANTSPELKSKYPLAEAKVEVKEIPGQPGCYHAVAWLRPWLQMEELTASMRMVARIPQIKR